MCGFAGLRSLHPKAVLDPEAFRRTGAALLHRGPDDGGELQESGFSLVHRRLSIIDLSRGARQPMLDPSGRWALLFNGEIYNFQELADRHLADLPWVNRGSDTSVLLGLFIRFGRDCLPLLNGMFAFAVADLQTRSLFLARDRFGEKPLYWRRTPDGLAFGSEIQAIKALCPQADWSIDPVSLTIYHVVGSIPAPRTVYREVQALPAGSFLEIAVEGPAEPQRYWSLAGLEPPIGPVSPGDARLACREALQEAVRSRMVSDVPVGIFLSGGIDSSSLLSIHRGLDLPPMDALCLDFDEPGFSEYNHAQTAAAAFGARLHRRTVTADLFLADLDRFFRTSDQPTTDGFNTFFVSRFGAEMGIKVWLSGVGGDEVFGGYPSFRRLGITRRLSGFMQACLPAALAESTPRFWPERPRLARLAQLADCGPSAQRGYQCLRNGIPWRVAAGALAPVRQATPQALLQNLDALYPEIRGEWTTFQQASAMELSVYMGSQLLRDMDNCSMAHSLELRAPFLDHRLVELVFSLPDRFKQGGDQPKPLLKAGLPMNLPANLASRPKRGFTFPLEIWMREAIRDSFQEHVLNPRNQGLWDLEQVRKTWGAHQAGQVHWSVLWVFYSLARWMEAHDERL